MIDRATEVGVVDNMRLRAAYVVREPRPFATCARQMQARRIDKPNRLAHLPLHLAIRHAKHVFVSPVNTNGLRLRLASANVERAGTLRPI